MNKLMLSNYALIKRRFQKIYSSAVLGHLLQKIDK